MWIDIEGRALKKGFKRPVGVDEAGRGPLAGPVVAGACYLPKSVAIDGLKDSKLLPPEARERIYHVLINHPEVDLGVGVVSHEEIDRINPLQASLHAMMLAVANLKFGADYLIVDGNRAPRTDLICDPIVKADAKVRSVAAASVIAKFYRDQLMLRMHELYPQYGFDRHMGYSTPEHLGAIRKFGPSPIHRVTYAPVKEALEQHG